MASDTGSSPKSHASQRETNSPLAEAGHVEDDIEVDSTGDSDSAYGDSLRSDLQSVTSSIARGVWENGRRYHSYGKAQYAFPNDEAETERLDMQHAMMCHLMGDKLFWAPIHSTPSKVLDLGTGTGIWAIDFADAFPSAEVIGTDLSAIQPTWVPQNCSFIIDDAEADWTFEPDSFDYIHNRNFVCSIRDWPRLIEQSYRALKPGGWVEWQEKHPWMKSDDGTIPEDSAIYRWGKHFFEAGDLFGTSPTAPTHLKTYMTTAGFTDIHEHILKIPVGPWPKDQRLKQVGLFEIVNMTEGIGALSVMLFTRALKWSREQVELFLMDVRKDVWNRERHGYYHFYVVFGRKPE